MTAIALPAETTRTATIAREIDHARTRGVLQHIVVPPCPALLARLQAAMAPAEPDLNEVARIAASDVAMAATLIRNANGPLYAAGQPVQTVGQAMNRLGLKHDRGADDRLPDRATRSPVDNRAPAALLGTLGAARDRDELHRAPAAGAVARRRATPTGCSATSGCRFCCRASRATARTMVEAAARVDRQPTSPPRTPTTAPTTPSSARWSHASGAWRPRSMAAIRLHHDLESLGGDETESEVQTLIASGLVAEHIVRRQEAQLPERDWSDHARHPRWHWLQVGEDEVGQWVEELGPALSAF
ncbi:MAG: HDOD domain-containing protein [Comamonadaceae bacterium]|nr:HDOD domain-containing protein [Comamonadaceae bacterium]